ncbi:hypothetical protein [Neisseria dentiae]|uniref:hypothetical protein n=1 Tax=Neisseria dentiae TaxID=194197 RepID=UPI0035A1002C
MNTQNYLVVSDLAYENLQEKQKIPGSDGVQYEVVKALHTKSGYDGYILHRKDTNELIVAHRGTWPEKGALTADVLTDLGMAVNQINNQYPDAKRLTEMAIKYSQEDIRYQGAAVRQAGHSLGGTLAQLCGYNYAQQTETFNAYGAADLKEKLHGRQNNTMLITNHVRGTDPVSAASPHLGKVEHYLNNTERAVLYGSGYGKLNILPNSPWQAAVGGVIMDHGIDNFQQGGLSARDRGFAAENRELLREFRSEFQKEAEKAGQNVKYIQDKVNESIRQSKDFLKISADSDTPETRLARLVANAGGGDRFAQEARHTDYLAAAPAAVQTAQAPQSKYDEVRAMLKGLLNDTDGSYAQKVLAEHPEQVARFDEKVRLSMEQDKQMELAARENQIQQETQQRGFSRSFG